jgi:hypothetical protein
MGVAAKKARQVQSALRRLAGEELVAPTRQKAASRKYEEFVLLHEGGRREHGPNVPYQVPSNKEGFTVPVELFSRGWIHVLEDTELAFILMIATCHHLQGGREFRLASADRLLRFGIGRDAYEAHKLLSRLQLLRVSADPDRHTDGTVEGYNSGTTALPHLFQFLPVGFDEDAVTAVREQIDYQLARS